MLRRGDYPRDPGGSVAREPGGGRRASRGAAYASALEIIAVLDSRLDKCEKQDTHKPPDRLLVEAFYNEEEAWREPVERLRIIANYYGLTPLMVGERVGAVVAYVAGWYEKKGRYPDYRKKRFWSLREYQRKEVKV